MSKPMAIEDLTKLPVSDRLKLIEELWQSLETDEADVPVPDWQRAELDKRLDAFERDPIVGRPWPEVRSEILASLRK